MSDLDLDGQTHVSERGRLRVCGTLYVLWLVGLLQVAREIAHVISVRHFADKHDQELFTWLATFAVYLAICMVSWPTILAGRALFRWRSRRKMRPGPEPSAT